MFKNEIEKMKNKSLERCKTYNKIIGDLKREIKQLNEDKSSDLKKMKDNYDEEIKNIKNEYTQRIDILESENKSLK